METDIKLGTVGDVDLKLEKGVMTLSAKVEPGAGVHVGASVGVDTDAFFDKLAEKIPGKFDDAIFAVLKAVCKQVG